MTTILSGIPTTLAEFFAEERQASPKRAIRADEFVELGAGGLSPRQVGVDLRDRKIQMLYETYPPGSDTGADRYSDEGEEASVLRAGDDYHFASANPHRFRNPSREICVIVSACAPPTF